MTEYYMTDLAWWTGEFYSCLGRFAVQHSPLWQYLPW